MAIIAIMVALSSLLVIIFIVIILYMLRWDLARQPEFEEVLNTSVSVCVEGDCAASPPTGSRNTSRREATPTPSGCPTGDQTIRVIHAHVNHCCAQARANHSRSALDPPFASADWIKSRLDGTRSLPPSWRSRLIGVFPAVGSRLLSGSDYLTGSQGCACLPTVTEFNCAALWWSSLHQRPAFKKFQEPSS